MDIDDLMNEMMDSYEEKLLDRNEKIIINKQSVRERLKVTPTNIDKSMLLTFVSPESLKYAFLDGIQQYNSYFNIQINYGEIAKIAKRLNKSEHYVSTAGLQAAAEWNRLMSSADDSKRILSVLQTFLEYQGAYAEAGYNTETLQYSRAFDWKSAQTSKLDSKGNSIKKRHMSSESLVSMSTFVYMAILHQATIFRGLNNKLNLYMIAAASNSPDTGSRPFQGVGAMIAKFITGRINSGNSLFLSEGDESELDMVSLPESEKILAGLAYLLSKTPEGAKVLGSIISGDRLKQFSELGKKLASSNNLTQPNINKDAGLSEKMIKNTGKYLALITQGISDYVSKVTNRVGQTDHFNLQLGLTAGNISMALKPLGYIPVLGGTIESYFNTILGGLADKKTYGVLEPHGVDGRVRAFLFGNACKNFAMHVRKTQQYLTSSHNKNRTGLQFGQLNKKSLLLAIDCFHNTYKDCLNIMPNRKGSLGTMLRMHANPDVDLMNGNLPDIDQAAMNKYVQQRL
ncbi:hypothetical protein FRA_41c09530 [Francisella sp. W12-1067]|nr:hypothetical protein FRA_41c09530 [Francisella sp. W12-1067]